MILIDTHTHVFGEAFAEDLDLVFQRMKKAGVQAALIPNVDLETIPQVLDTVTKYPMAKPMWGLHPCHVFAGWKEDLEKIKPLFGQHKAAAVGEIGLDFYWSKEFAAEQEAAFETQMSWALELGLPVSLHSRAAMHRSIEMVRPFAQRGLRGVFHCFSGSEADARAVLDMNFCLGIGGPVTYKKSENRDYLKKLPLEGLVLETDAPYLSPVPYRGKRNEPAYLTEIVFMLASIYGTSADVISKTTSQTANNLFNLGLQLD
jgi:TatD DNase family protein